ncbi:MAG: hypothetical protein ABH843_01070 [Candidatus Omnitrophota bacterium]
MVDIQKKYTLSKLALVLGVSASWVNKVQTRTGIGGDTGKRGVRVFFTDDELYVFRSVKLLRILNYSLSDIRKIYDIEKKMLASKSINSKYRTNAAGEGYCYIIHPFNFTYDERAHAGKDMQEYDLGIGEYKQWAEYIYKMSAEISNSAKKLEDEYKDFTMSISKNVTASQNLPPDTV